MKSTFSAAAVALLLFGSSVSASCVIATGGAKCYTDEALLDNGPVTWYANAGDLVVADCYKGWSRGDAL
jgi:hypothetical protein